MPERRGFTMVELVVVISIIAILAGMLAPMIGIARRQARKQATITLMNKIEVALTAFRSDAGALPWRAHPASDDGPWGNELAYRLAHRLDAGELSKLKQDLYDVRQAYAVGGAQRITAALFDQPRDVYRGTGTWSSTNDRTCASIIVNRLGAERATVAVMSGNTGITATRPNGGQPWIDAGAILTSPSSRGWADDYLEGQLRRGDYSLDAGGLPDAILDAYGTPLVYVHARLNGVQGSLHQDVDGQVMAEWFGFAPRLRMVSEDRASDVRTHAARQYVASHELWSAGDDRRFHALRTDAANRDNIAAIDWQRGLR